MAVAEITDLAAYCRQLGQRARQASARLACLGGEQKNLWLARSAALLRERSAWLLEANQHDIAAAPGFGLTDAQTERLRLTSARIEGIALALDEVAALPDPVGETIEGSVRPNGLEVRKIRVPLGVIFFIYESRPNVTVDAAALCVKSGNAVILRGGREATHSNRALVQLLHEAADTHQIPLDAVQLVATPDREAVGHLLSMPEYVDLTIPRGGEGLIRRVAEQARMPVIKHFTGNCHVYVDRDANLAMAERITVNAKCQRVSVCNAAESLLVHTDLAPEFLPRVGLALRAAGVEIRGDQISCELMEGSVPAAEEDYGEEYLDLILSVKVVESLDEAIAHINRFGSHHTDTIVTDRLEAAQRFVQQVDSAAVMVNASTRFNDGGELGLGAEIGISTDKFHARGPCGLKELTSYKWVVYGQGQVRQ